MIGMKCIFGVGNYVKYKVVEIRNNFFVCVRLLNMFLIFIF